MKKRIIIFSSIFVVLVAAIVCLLVFLLPSRNNRSNNSGGNGTPEQEQSSNINGIRYDDYTDTNMSYLLTTIEDTFDISPEVLFPGTLSSWKKNYYKASMNGFVNAFKKADIDIEKFKNFTLFIKDYPKLLESVNFNLDSILTGEEITGAQLFELLSKSENINAIYRIIISFYNTGITNEDVANVLYYYIQNEMGLLSQYRTDLYMSLTDSYDTAYGSVSAFVRSTVYDVLPELYSAILSMDKQDYIDIMTESLDAIRKALQIYKDYNFYALVDLLTMLKNGELKPEELAVMMHELQVSLDDIIDPETGKAFNISNQFYGVFYSIASKVPLVLNIISTAAKLPNMTEFLPYLANSLKDVEEFLNRLIIGIREVVGQINMEENIYVRDASGNVIDKISMAEAICTHLSKIATDEGYVTADSDTVILISKAIAPLFRDDGLNKTFLKKLFNNGSSMFISVLEMLENFEVETAITSEGFETSYSQYQESFFSIMDLVDYIASFDMGDPESKLMDASPSYIVMQTFVNDMLNAIINEDVTSFSKLSMGISTVIAVPIIIALVPTIAVATIVGAPIVAVYVVLEFTIEYTSNEDGEGEAVVKPSFTSALSSMLAGMFGKARDEDGNIISDSEEYVTFGESMLAKLTDNEIVKMFTEGNILTNIITAIDNIVKTPLSKIMYYSY